MDAKRKVIVYKYEMVKGKGYYDKVVVGPGVFHQFGVNYEEYDSGPGNFTTAVIEMPDGSVANIPVDLIVFDDLENKE